MYRFEFIEQVNSSKIPLKPYSFEGGMPEGCYTIECTSQETWHVYFVENNSKKRLKIFLSESKAFEYLWEEISRNDTEHVSIKSEFFKVIFVVVTLGVVYAVGMGIYLFLYGHENWDNALSQKVALACFAVGIIGVWFILSRDKLVLTEDKLEIYNLWGLLKETVCYKDITSMGYSQFKTTGDVMAKGNFSFSMDFKTIKKQYSYSSIMYLNLKKMHLFLVSKVDSQPQIPPRGGIFPIVISATIGLLGLLMMIYAFVKPMVTGVPSSPLLAIGGGVMLIMGYGFFGEAVVARYGSDVRNIDKNK